MARYKASTRSFQNAATRASSGSNVSKPPTRLGLLKSIETDTATPQGRSTSAIRAICGMKPSVITKRIRVDVVDGHAVDAHGCEQAAVVPDAAQIVQDAAILEEDRPARISTLDRSVQIVPVIHPPDGCSGLLPLIQS